MEAGQQGQQELIRATVAPGSSCRQHPVPWNKPSSPHPSSTCQQPRRTVGPEAEPSGAPAHEDMPPASSRARWSLVPSDDQTHMGARSKPDDCRRAGLVDRGKLEGHVRLGGALHPMCGPHPWKKYDGNILSSMSVRLGSASHIAWGPGQRRAAWGPAGEAGWAGQHPRTWGGLALIDSCGWSS